MHMNPLFQELDRLLAAAREDGSLRRQLLATRHAADPMDAFCRLAQSLGLRSTSATSLPRGRNTATTSARARTAAIPARTTPLTTHSNFSYANWNRAASLPNSMERR